MFSFSMPLLVEVDVSVAANSERLDKHNLHFSQNLQVYSFTSIQ